MPKCLAKLSVERSGTCHVSCFKWLLPYRPRGSEGHCRSLPTTRPRDTDPGQPMQLGKGSHVAQAQLSPSKNQF